MSLAPTDEVLDILGREAWVRERAEQLANHHGAHVYFVVAPLACRVKVGSAIDPLARLKVLQTGCPEPLHLAGLTPSAGLAGEYRLRRELSDSRDVGEWFHLDDAVIAAIRWSWVELSRHGLTLGQLQEHLAIVAENEDRVRAAAKRERDEVERLRPFFTSPSTTRDQALARWERAQAKGKRP